MKRFNRFELKYSITAAQCRAVKRNLADHMLPDGNSADDGFYDIASLYYDTPDLAFMRSRGKRRMTTSPCSWRSNSESIAPHRKDA